MSISIIAAALFLVAGQAAAPSELKSPAIDPDKKICKTIKDTGSRLGGTRECKTRAEWDRIAAETQAKATSNMGR